LIELEKILQPFLAATLYSQGIPSNSIKSKVVGNMEHSNNGTLTDVLPLMDYLLLHLETLKKVLAKTKSPLLPAIEQV